MAERSSRVMERRRSSRRIRMRPIRSRFRSPTQSKGGEMRQMRYLILAALIVLASRASAQDIPIQAQGPIALTNVAERGHVTVNGGALVLTSGDDWSGASLGAAVGYNLHQQFTVFGGYDHGIPI